MWANSTLEVRYKLNAKQLEFHRSPKKYNAFVAGIGAGKSWVSCVEGLLCATNPGSLGAIVAPNYRMLRDSTYRTFMDVCPRSLILKVREAKNEVVLRTSGKPSEILFRSADDPESLRGPSLSWFVLDEASLMNAETWKIMIGRLRQPGQPLKGMVATTPKGKNWVYDVFVRKPTPQHAAFTCPTMVNQKNLPPSFIADLESQYAGDFKRQELYGEFVAYEGLVYPLFDPLVHVIDNESLLPLTNYRRIVAGIDWGFSNPFALLALGIDGDGRVDVLDEVYMSRLAPEQVLSYCNQFQDLYHPDTFYCDPAEPANIQMLTNAGLSAVPAVNDIMPGISHVTSFMPKAGDGRTRFRVAMRCSGLISEFGQYAYGKDKNGHSTERPVDTANHSLAALRYALYTMERKQPLADEPVTFGEW
jgi:PBSX family phage terminase large subunit